MRTEPRTVTLGPSASDQWLSAPSHLAMVLARYKAASVLIGSASSVVELGCGEGIGARILASARDRYVGLDSDHAAIVAARRVHDTDDWRRLTFRTQDFLTLDALPCFEAVVAIDVVEHIEREQETAFFELTARLLVPSGVCVIGTPSAAFDHLASEQSAASHVNTYTHERLYLLMARYYRVVQSFGMQDVALHFGHPDARHYLIVAGVMPR
jgi:cyclopropane fatty-acyl-phospholipid synthase-like methyltransferase